MARATSVASNSTDVQAYTGSGCLVGVMVLAGASNATVRVHDGTSTAGAVLAVCGALANTSEYHPIPAGNVDTGLFLDRTNAAELVLFLL